MIELIGWLAFTLGGAYIAFTVASLIAGLRGGGIEAAGAMIVWGMIAAVIWSAFALWLSPLTFSIQ